MFSFFKKLKPHTQFFLLTCTLAAMIVACHFISVALEEVAGFIIGYMLALIASGYLYWLHELTEDKKKMSQKNYPYDEKTYRLAVKMGDKTNHVWYRTCAKGQDIKEIYVDDKDLFTYQLDPIIAANYASILDAHKASFIKNVPMIRLDDYTFNRESGELTLHVSRTMYYNDLVTNRAMDYPFAGNMTVRDVFESRPHISTLKDSKLSNHIGINAMVFYGDHLILAHRGGNSTMSKHGITSAIALGMSEANVIACRPADAPTESVVMCPKDVEQDIILSCLLDAFAGTTMEDMKQLVKEGYIKVYFLGFGQLLYMGGKPQIYYAVTIAENSPLSRPKMEVKKEKIDAHQQFIYARKISLDKDDTDVLTIDGKIGADGRKYKTYHIKAETSFYVNWMHLLEYGRIDGIPDWVYENNEK